MMLGLLTILCAWILIKIYRYGTYNFSYWEKKKIPYIKPTFFFGILYDTIINQELIGVYLAKFYNTFTGPFFGCFALQIPILVLTDLDAIKSFLLKDARYFSNRYIYNNPDVDPIIAYGLFGARGPLWKILKPSLTKLFTLSKIKSIFKLSKESRRHFNDYLESKVNQNIEAKAMSQKFVSNLLARSVFGVHVNTFADENSPFNMPRKKFFGTSFVRTFTLLCYYYCPTLVRLFRLKFCNHRIQKYFVSVFNESITKREALKIKQGDMIDLLVEFKNKKQAKLGLSWDVVTAQACLFYVSGQESIASTIAFTLHELCLNTDVQSRLRKEIRDTKKKHGEITYNSLQEMKYLDMVVSETLRKYPAVPQIHRECVKNYKVPNTNITIENGTFVTVSTFGIQRNPKYFPDPEKYDPERFNSFNRNKIEYGSYLPFGEGLRGCIAQVFGITIVKIGIVEVIEKYKTVKNSKTAEEIEFTMFPVLVQAKQPLNMTIRTN